MALSMWPGTPWTLISRFLSSADRAFVQRASSRTLATAGAFQDSSYLANLSSPASWYAAARKMRRQVICHLGPANSGKTFQALEALKQAKNGVYCGPLRLLASEVAEKLNTAGTACNLVTGQERCMLPGATHAACTVEMASVVKPVAVAVLDEVQMMSDPVRGHAFTRALLGLPAASLHVCGDLAAWDLLKKILTETGDRVELRSYQRLGPLKASSRPLGGLEKVQRGDCVVAFSRREVHALRHKIETTGGSSCCVVYGALPPEARSQQAALFNTPRTGFNVLVASDAIGMGLNLNIKRVVFASTEKFDGRVRRSLTAGEAKQIAGRAGRFGSTFATGTVTALSKEDLDYLREAIAAPSAPLEQACLFPRFEQLALFAEQHPGLRFPEALCAFADQASLHPHYFFGDVQVLHELALMLDHLPLSLAERYVFMMSPVDPSDVPVASALLTFASTYCSRRSVHVSIIGCGPRGPPRDESELAQLEALYRILDLYIWLSWRFRAAFHGREAAVEQQALCAQLIGEGLQGMGVNCIPRRVSAAARVRGRGVRGRNGSLAKARSPL